MKWTGICLAAIIVIANGVHPQTTAQGWSEISPLIELAAFAEDEQLEVTELNITLKESINYEYLQETQQKIKQQFQSDKLTEEETTEATKYIYEKRHKNGDFVEQFMIVVPKLEDISFEVVYTVTSQGTKPLASQFMVLLSDRVKAQIFTTNVTLYSFIKTEINGIIDEVLLYQKFQQTFDITNIEQTTDESWTSRSGYTKRWDGAIELPSGAMNVQFAARNLGSATNVTIGTPILTAEY
ncbi:YwmB family TATA-box binding protein [Halobacillus campisalis]|uniref:YwmB family TATA-box binding protein n=1 Tax=Halobacillus campisalis TaxID=435909 RepID=A0ABW2JZI8_9BACI|nr:YwmB family TATA-box binding protein [Halobacillus campisalis]